MTRPLISQVKTGQGHSWKGSVVSDTVKRAPGNLSSLQMVPMQWKLHNQSSLGKEKNYKSTVLHDEVTYKVLKLTTCICAYSQLTMASM